MLNLLCTVCARFQALESLVPICPMPKTVHLLVGGTEAVWGAVHHWWLPSCWRPVPHVFSERNDKEDMPPKDATEGSTRLCAFLPGIFSPLFSQTTELTKPAMAVLFFGLGDYSSHLEASAACWIPVHSLSYSSCWTFYMSLLWLQLMLALYEYSCQEELKHSHSTQLSPTLHVCDAGNNTTHLPEQCLGQTVAPGLHLVH